METKTIEKYFFFGLLLGTLIFSFLIFRPFWTVLVLGISFSIVFYPFYEKLNKIHLPHWLSSLLTVLVFTILVCGPLFGIGAIIFNQSQDVYHLVVNNGSAGPFMNSISDTINDVLPEGVVFNANEKASDFISFVSKNVANIFSSTVSAFFSFILMLLIMFYFLKDGAKWRKAVIVLSPLADRDDEKIISRLRQAVNSVIKGSLLIALIQGVLMGLGLWLFGIPNSALWGIVAAVASLLPTIGTASISVPAIAFLFITGNVTGAVGLAIWAGVVVGLIDNFLSPVIISEKTNIPPLLILFAVLGGLSLLGPVGILVGPLTISLLYTLIAIYRNEFNQHNFTI
ncbi:AI-2E family transporter [Candidatus Nomurabacteria bacterium]|nr:AI-2E family transporter [Candidatus Nomurabacteria bacterium]